MPHILALPRAHAPALPVQGCWAVTNLDFLQHAQWQNRAQVEQNEAWLQPIPYLVLLNQDGHLWCYQRSGGDARLNGRCSCGVGGHVDAVDAQDSQPAPENNAFDSYSRSINKGYRPILSINPTATLQHALLREVAEELSAGPTDLANLQLHGLLYEGHSAVGRVHLGVLYSARWLPAAAPKPVAGEALAGLGFRDANAIVGNPQFELWSQLAAQHLL